VLNSTTDDSIAMGESIQDLIERASQSNLYWHAQILGLMVGVLWVVELLDQLLLAGRLDRYGIRPRRWDGIQGIILAPLLHGNWQHLSANTMPLVLLGWLILLGGVPSFVLVTAVVWIAGGWGVWLLGKSRSVHIGASGIVFGYLGFLLSRGYFERSPAAIALAAIAGLFYGGLIWGILPLRKGQSWEGHLCGFIAGGMLARHLAT
jgi:membrane associated rhomboid family serine protease